MTILRFYDIMYIKLRKECGKMNNFDKDPSEIKKDFICNKLKRLRQEMIGRQDEFAKEIGLPLKDIKAIERKEREPNLYELQKIARFLNVSLDYIFGLDEFPTKTYSEIERELFIVRKEFLKLKMDKVEQSRHNTDLSPEDLSKEDLIEAIKDWEREVFGAFEDIINMHPDTIKELDYLSSFDGWINDHY